jgi:outer membrane murein-binding lipoprotein Lpp
VGIEKHRSSLQKDLRRYMLGELTELEQQAYEGRLLSEDEMFREVEELVEVVQDEVVEDYLAGELSETQRRIFEQYQLVCPKIHEMRLVQEALRKYPKRQVRRQTISERLRLWFQPALRPAPALAAALTFLLIAGGIWSIREFGQLSGKVDQASLHSSMLSSKVESLQRELDQERRDRDALSQQLVAAARSGVERVSQTQQSFAPRETGGILSFALLPGLQRSSGAAARIVLSSGQNVLELKLDIGLDEYVSYQATVFNSATEMIVEQQHLSAVHIADRVYVLVHLPRPILRDDDYLVILRGVNRNGNVEMLDRFSFRLTLRH